MTRFLLLIFLFVVPTELLFSQSVSLADSLQLKIAASLRTTNSETNVRIQVSNTKKFIDWLVTHLPDASAEKQAPNVYHIKGISKGGIDTLVTSPWITFIDRADRVPKEEQTLTGFDFTLNKISSVHAAYSSLNGENLVVSIKEKPFDIQDIDFRNRIVLNDQFDEPSTQHATAMATIIAGAGNSDPTSRGVASSSGITTSDFLQLLPDDGNTLIALNVSVQNHSYGVGVENYYGIESSSYDQHCRDFPTILHVFSSGNEGDKADNAGTYANINGFANLTGQFKVSKNTLSVGSSDVAGNVVTRSSRGPAHDGRVKPELIAFGDAGSSEAAAVVSGISLLLQQAYQNQTGSLPTSSLLKAILLNSADDSGRPEVDFETGFGNVDALGAVRTIEENRFLSGTVLQGGENTHTITVPTGAYQLKITIVWNDVEAAPFTSHALVNDIDLLVAHPSSGDQWRPWVLSHYPHRDSLLLPAKRKEDHTNNVEQVTIQLPQEGNYELTIKGFSISQGPQSYSVVYQFESGFEWINPLVNTSFEAGRNNIVRWRWSDIASIGKLEYKFIDQAEWIDISNSINLSNQYFQWVTPDTTALAQLRFTVNSNTYESGVFSIIKPLSLKVGYNCTDEVMLLWRETPGAEQYQLYRLGEKYMEPFIITADTFALLNSIQKEVLHYAVAPVVQGNTFAKGSTIDYTNLGTACYLISFIPKQYVVNDVAVFDLKIGTTYKLQSATLERFKNSAWYAVQTISPVTNTEILLTDNNPEPEINIYRVRLLDDNDLSIYSNEEEIFYARKSDLFVFPNPVVSGESLNIVVSDDEAVRIRLYDIFGRPIRETVDPGAIKTIDTGALLRGAYILEVLKANGKKLTTRLLIL